MYSTLLLLKFSKCNMLKYFYKIIHTMYFILYQVIRFIILFYIKCHYTAVLWVTKISFPGGIDKELNF